MSTIYSLNVITKPITTFMITVCFYFKNVFRKKKKEYFLKIVTLHAHSTLKSCWFQGLYTTSKWNATTRIYFMD